jgi:Uncharacterized low-complexity proteins
MVGHAAGKVKAGDCALSRGGGPLKGLMHKMRGTRPSKAGKVVGLALAVIGVLAAPPVRADCNDSPVPQVDWVRCYMDGRDFQGADLTAAELRDASFFRAHLKGANFSGADAYRAKFYLADLTGARFDKARLAEADFTDADLRGASLRNADLRGAKLVSADLRNADLTGANLRSTDLFRANLAGATWIDGKRRCAEGSVGQCN